MNHYGMPALEDLLLKPTFGYGYMNGGEDLAIPLGRVEAAGGKILQNKTSIGEHGFMAVFRDTEGNRIALHSMK